MSENEILGKYIQKRLREKGIEDKEVAEQLNLSVRTVPNMYQQSEIPVNRIAKLSILLDEDIYLNYFGTKEPLKSILNRSLKTIEEQLLILEEINEFNLSALNDKNNIIELQNKLIKELEDKIKRLNSED